MPVPMESYIGDGVYASMDDGDLVLDLRGQDNFTKIVLEPQVFENLLRFMKVPVVGPDHVEVFMTESDP